MQKNYFIFFRLDTTSHFSRGHCAVGIYKPNSPMFNFNLYILILKKMIIHYNYIHITLYYLRIKINRKVYIICKVNNSKIGQASLV